MRGHPERQSRLLDPGDIGVSFEFFPPKTEKMAETLWTAVRRLEPFGPRFVSVTYGAGGSTRDRTHATVERIIKETTLEPAAHLTCVDAVRGEIDDIVRSYADVGVKHIVALRGDSPCGAGAPYRPTEGGYCNAAELVTGIKRLGQFEVSVAGYPEGHPDSISRHLDIDNLRAKYDAGADRIITQFFFDNDDYFRYLDRVAAAQIDLPVTAGIIPLHNFQQVAGFAARCGAKVPSWLAHRFEGIEDDPQTQQLVAAAVAAEQVDDLADRGVRDFHFYTLNRADLVYAICHLLGLRPKTEQRGEAAA